MSKEREITDFITSSCNRDAAVVATVSRMYEHYLEWANNRTPMTRREFVGTVRQCRGVKYGVYWIGGKSQRGFKGVSPRRVTSHKAVDYPREAKRRPSVVPDVHVYRFLRDCCEVVPGAPVVSTCFDLYAVYDDWAGDQAGRYTSKKMLTQRIARALGGAVKYGVYYVDGKTERGFRGLLLKSS